MGSALILTMHQVVCGDLMPDMTILMDSDPAASVARARRRNRANVENGLDENRFEKETAEFFARVHAAYLAIAAREPHRVYKVDARRPKDVTHPEIVAAIAAEIARVRDGRPLVAHFCPRSTGLPVENRLRKCYKISHQLISWLPGSCVGCPAGAGARSSKY